VNVRFLEVATTAKSPGLGDALLIEVVTAIERIRAFPNAWHPLGDELRRCRLRRFPYGLIYALEKGEILVLALAHARREPQYWRERVKR
jgi:hypothetical protein